MTRGKGYRRDMRIISPPAKPLFGARRGIAASAALSGFVDQVHDQGPTSACVSFWLAMALYVRAKALRTPIPWPSTAAIYACARAVERRASIPKDAPPDYQLPALQDNGSEPSLAAAALVELGSCADADWPFDPSKVNDEAMLGALEEMSRFTLTGTYQIDTLDQERVLDVCTALSEGFPVGVGISTDKAWDEYNATSPPLGAADPNDQRGGHMVTLLDYWHEPDGSLLFRGVNSWGDGVTQWPWSDPAQPPWGQKGFFVAKPEWLTSPLTDAPIVTTMSAHAPPQAA